MGDKTSSPFRVNPYAAQAHIEEEYHEEFHQCQVLALVLRLIVIGFVVSLVGVIIAVVTTNAWLESQGVYRFGDLQLPWQYYYLIASTWMVPAVLMLVCFFAAVTRLEFLEGEIRCLQSEPVEDDE